MSVTNWKRCQFRIGVWPPCAGSEALPEGANPAVPTTEPNALLLERDSTAELALGEESDATKGEDELHGATAVQRASRRMPWVRPRRAGSMKSTGTQSTHQRTTAATFALQLSFSQLVWASWSAERRKVDDFSSGVALARHTTV